MQSPTYTILLQTRQVGFAGFAACAKCMQYLCPIRASRSAAESAWLLNKQQPAITVIGGYSCPTTSSCLVNHVPFKCTFDGTGTYWYHSHYKTQ